MQDRLRPNGSIVLMGGISSCVPTRVDPASANNGSVSALVRTSQWRSHRFG